MVGNVKPGRSAFLCCLIAVALICGCARTPEQKYAKFLETGRAQLAKHDYPRAILQFKNAIQVKPKSAEAYYQLALAYAGANDVPTAVKCLWKSLQLDPKYTAADLKLSELAVATRNPAEVREAEKHARQVLKDSPANTDALDVLAQAEWQLGNQEEAEKLLNEAFARSPQDLKSPTALAQIKLSRKDVAGAEAILKKAAEANPNRSEAALILGRFYAATGRPSEAEPQFERALKLEPKNGAALVSLASLRWQAGKAEGAEQLYKQAAALPDPRYQPVHAIFLFRTGKRDQAIDEFEKIYKRNPSDREARTRLVMAYEAANRPSDAENVIAAALKKNPKDINALLDQSAIYLRNGNPTQAQTALLTALHFQPDSAKLHYLLASVDQALGKPEIRRQELAEAIRLDPNLLPARMQLAELLISNKGAKEARGLLEETPPAQKNDPGVLVHTNWADIALGNRAEARKGVDRLLAANRQPEALVQDATLKMMERNYTGARQSLEEALQKSPEDAEALNLMVQSYQIQKQFPTAVQWLRAYAARMPKSAPVQFYLGQILMQSGDYSSARTALAAAKAADPKLIDADLLLAQLDARDGKLDDARKRLFAVITAKPADVSAHLLLGNVEQAASNYAAAIEQYRKAVELDEGSVEALNDLAYSLAEFGKQPDEALQFAQKAEELAPNDPTVADTLGWVLYRKALYTSAVPYLEQAANRQPSGLRKCHLALAYMKSGNQLKGRQMLAAALQMDPSLSHSELVQEAGVSQSASR